MVNPVAKVALSDWNKRRELLHEFHYYIFDSILIPLIRSNFHVTESNVHGNRLFYFRHDIWRYYTEPEMSRLKLSMFEDIKPVEAKKVLDSRVLGFSQIRLLPKANGVRPITNLRRRVTSLKDGRITLGRSINSIMAPVFNILECERRKNPTLIGSSLFSVGDLYPKLNTYARMLRRQNSGQQHLYFVKADAKSCFDTIPQKAIVRLIKTIAAEDVYRIGHHAEVKNTESHTNGKQVFGSSKPARKFISTARAATDFPSFDEAVKMDFVKAKKNTVFVDGIVQVAQKTSKLLRLLEDHVQGNIIKIGKKFYRQKAGIPQGSVLSSLLCSFFYAELEENHFGFLQQHESILLRLIDDFLLITANKTHAHRFLQVMHNGIEEYGVEVNPSKSLVNFAATINGHQVPQLQDTTKFPYCGNMIDTRTLEITKDRDRRKGTGRLWP